MKKRPNKTAPHAPHALQSSELSTIRGGGTGTSGNGMIAGFTVTPAPDVFGRTL